jgi:hypothetical protein
MKCKQEIRSWGMVSGITYWVLLRDDDLGSPGEFIMEFRTYYKGKAIEGLTRIVLQNSEAADKLIDSFNDVADSRSGNWHYTHVRSYYVKV